MLEAIYFDGQTAKKRQVSLSFEGGNVLVQGDGVDHLEPFTPVMLSEKLGNAPRQLYFSNRAYCLIQDHVAFEAMLREAGFKSHSTVSHLEAHWRYALIALVLTLLAVIAAYIWALPILADEVAKRIPPALTAKMDQQTLMLLEKSTALTSTKLTIAQQQAIRQRIQALQAPAGQAKPAFRLVFRNSEAIGPNAFALPGGSILVTDQLVTLAGPANQDQVIGVLTHELGHVYHRHALRQFVQGSIVAVVMTWYLGDISSLLASVPTAMLQTKYSRALENEADDYAISMLKTNHISSEVLADMLMKLEGFYKLQKPVEKDSHHDLEEYFSTHPLTQSRIKKLRTSHHEK